MSHTEQDPALLADQDEARTLRTSKDHHAGLRARLGEYTDELIEAVALGADSEPARRQLVAFLTDDLLAHLESEQQILYAAAREVGADSLVASLEVEHDLLVRTISELERAAPGLAAALAGHAVLVLVGLRIEKEETVLIPMLAAAGIDVRALLADMVVRMATKYGSRFTYM